MKKNLKTPKALGEVVRLLNKRAISRQLLLRNKNTTLLRELFPESAA